MERCAGFSASAARELPQSGDHRTGIGERITAVAATAEAHSVRCISRSQRARSISTKLYASCFELKRRIVSEQAVMYSH
jgi:hypothetical protein